MSEVEKMFLEAAGFRMYWCPPTDFMPFARCGYRVTVRGKDYGTFIACDADDLMENREFLDDATRELKLSALDTIMALMNGAVHA